MQRQEALKQSTEANSSQSIGSHLVCPICGLLRINHDCIAELENPKPKKREVSLQELLGGESKRKPTDKPRKQKALKGGLATFFAWEDESGEIVKQRGYKDPKLIAWAMENADLYSIGQFEKGGNGHNRNLENQVSITESFSEIDSDIPLDPKEIVACARAFELPPITKIKKSVQDNHYHINWDYRKPVEKKDLSYWVLIQEKIHMVFKSLGADPIPVKDPIRYLRTDKYKTVYKTGRKTSLGEFYKAFVKNGLINVIPLNSRKQRRRNQKSFNNFSIPTLENYFREHPDFISTHEEVYTKLGIPESTYYYLLPGIKRAGLKTERIRVGKSWKTHFIFVDTLRNTFFNTGGERIGVYPRGLDRAKKEGITEQYRNIVVFGESLYLRFTRLWGFERVLMELEPVFREIEEREPLGVSGKGRFTRREFEKTVRSAFNPKYNRFCGWGSKSETLERMSEWLNLECETVIDFARKKASASIAKVAKEAKADIGLE